MSFSQDTKTGLSRIYPEKKCCMLAEIAGFLRVNGSLGLAGGGRFRILVSTDNAAVARHYKKLLSMYFRIDPELKIESGSGLHRGYRYSLAISPEMHSESILRETGILLVKEGENYISDGIYPDIIRKKCDRKSYLKGVFMAAGSVADPAKEYHLEFVIEHEALANDVKKLIGSFEDLGASIAVRKGKYVVYVKRSEYIRDILALMGAGAEVMAIENAKINKEMIGATNRITNCDTANTDRAIDAASAQIAAIRKLVDTGEIANLTDKLREIAMLRLENPEASISELGEMMDPPLKKSGVNGRLMRVMKHAEELG